VIRSFERPSKAPKEYAASFSFKTKVVRVSKEADNLHCQFMIIKTNHHLKLISKLGVTHSIPNPDSFKDDHPRLLLSFWKPVYGPNIPLLDFR